MVVCKTLKFRIKGNTKWLEELAKEVNFVWNYCNNLNFYMIKNHRKWLSWFDMNRYLKGCTKLDGGLKLYYNGVQHVAKNYVEKRNQFKKLKLRYRCKKSLGWVPLTKRCIKFVGDALSYHGHKFKVWNSYNAKNYNPIDNGSFNQDSKGNWYLNLVVEDQPKECTSTQEVGIDLGFKDLATLSTGEKIENPQFYRKTEEKLAKAQRARKKKLVRNLHNKIKNQRKDFLHKASTKIAKENKLIVVGNVNSSKLAKTTMAKSVNDVSWYAFKQMLKYKAIRHSATYLEVNESWTTQTCNVCKNRTGPKGLEGLGIREWVCCDCGSVHDRDTNSAINTLRLGHQALAEGASIC